MSLASVWRALQEASKANLKDDDAKMFLKCVWAALGKLGWAVFLWANYGLVKLLIVDGGSIGDLSRPYVWLYGIGFVMILVFDINWKDMGTVIYMPFSFINSFVDVLSYIRLFAVGLSSVYIADSFNNMATGISAGNPWLIPVSLLVLAIGHALNIALACMGVLVHGVRLNTLEFSGRMDLSWTGKPYKPLSNDVQ
jgi:V/A-type H+-transporting ATPase subunit I